MKKHLAALWATAAAAMPAAAQQATSSVTLYGITDVAVTHISNRGGASLNLLDSGRLQSSRFGFRGCEDLGNGLTGLFTLENGFTLDTGAQRLVPPRSVRQYLLQRQMPTHRVVRRLEDGQRRFRGLDIASQGPTAVEHAAGWRQHHKATAVSHPRCTSLATKSIEHAKLVSCPGRAWRRADAVCRHHAGTAGLRLLRKRRGLVFLR
ncbi:porin [Azohydromonas australica]|uniref:porin n=1 Tax=Azohydromonas australica TaxID=364039 RepID=UPI000409CC5D|nr:porin [Azohydromonas australica]